MNEEATFLFCVIILPNSDDLFAMARWVHLGHNLISILLVALLFFLAKDIMLLHVLPKTSAQKRDKRYV